MSVADVVAKRPLLAVLLIIGAFVAASVSAAVFVYYPLRIDLRQVAPPVIFVSGSNSNGTDLGGNTIYVEIGPNGTSAYVLLHPTYQLTYYHGVLNITNTDSNQYYIKLRLVSQNITAAGVDFILNIVDKTGSVVGSIDTTAGTTETTWIALSGGNTFQIDVEVLIPEGNQLITDRLTAELQLIYSTQGSINAPTP